LDRGRRTMGILRDEMEGRRAGWDVRLDSSIDVRGERGEVVFCRCE
jgi:hypothetical protein